MALCHDSRERKAIADSLRHDDHFGDDVVRFETPKMISSSSKAGLHLI